MDGGFLRLLVVGASEQGGGDRLDQSYLVRVVVVINILSKNSI